MSTIKASTVTKICISKLKMGAIPVTTQTSQRRNEDSKHLRLVTSYKSIWMSL